MGLLRRISTSALNFNKVIISLWFRLPSETVESVQAQGIVGGWGAIAPLLTWGPQLTSQFYNNITVDGAGLPTTIPQGPSYIGANCATLYPIPRLEALIQTASTANCSNVRATNGPTPETLTDISFVEEAYRDFFNATSTTEVAADQLHHLWISWDLSGGSSSHGNTGGSYADGFVATSRMYVVFDGENKTNTGLPADWTETGPNSIASAVVARYSGLTDIGLGPPSVTLNIGSIPSSPLFIPAPESIEIWNTPSTIVPGRRVQMGRLQIFNGVALDPGSSGQIIGAFLNDDGSAADPRLAAQLIGKSPEIEFRTESDWINGRNRGTAGDFAVTGSIRSYDGDLQLGS